MTFLTVLKPDGVWAIVRVPDEPLVTADGEGDCEIFCWCPDREAAEAIRDALRETLEEA